ncbi:MAG: hypothetical protein DWI54_00410 [Chloroflexi bacterium]|nr:MAG: hypothetical protein DWI54_00410 [Chloroflexota bacterium]RLT34228.1 MAG: hypothetical protein DWI55_00380 [Chloroflexota bacterium]
MPGAGGLSLLPTPYSLLTTHYSLLTTPYSLLPTHAFSPYLQITNSLLDLALALLECEFSLDKG